MKINTKLTTWKDARRLARELNAWCDAAIIAKFPVGTKFERFNAAFEVMGYNGYFSCAPLNKQRKAGKRRVVFTAEELESARIIQTRSA